MRIGVDARELVGHATGVGRYLGGLLREWSTSPEAKRHEFVLYAPGDIPMPLDTRRFLTRGITGSGGTFWEQVRLPAVVPRDHLDVWFSPAYSAPLALRVPTVVAIHDLSFVAHPEWFRLREGARRRLLSRRAAAKARAIITISEFSRQEIVERLELPAERIHVIPPGVTVPARSPALPGDAATSVLYVGSIFNRRHVPDLVRAFAMIARRRPGASLDLVGDNRSYPYEDIVRLIAIEGLEGQARWHRYASEERLQQLYGRARAFVFLSEYEGLGLPPLEALAAGVPPVVLDTPVARESCGEAAFYVASRDPAAIAGALETVLFDEMARTRILAAAPAALARYRWPAAAARTLAVLESAQ
jgi:glycosyltransferase involved in cell wall biosynthesis